MLGPALLGPALFGGPALLAGPTLLGPALFRGPALLAGPALSAGASTTKIPLASFCRQKVDAEYKFINSFCHSNNNGVLSSCNAEFYFQLAQKWNLGLIRCQQMGCACLQLRVFR